MRAGLKFTAMSAIPIRAATVLLAACSLQVGPIEDLLGGDFDWTTDAAILKIDTGKLPPPPSGGDWSQVKDPSVVRYQNRWHLFCSILNPGGHDVSGRLRIGYMSFSDWKDAQAAAWHLLELYRRGDFVDYHGAPQVFYFEPQKKWYLIYQLVDKARGIPYGPCYSTSADLGDPHSWTAPQLLHTPPPGNAGLDHWVICDDAHAYHFWTSLDGNMWMVRTQLASFPGSGWSAPVVVLKHANVFEGSHTYRIKGTKKYLTIAVNGSSPRFYQAYVADQLSGPWTPVAATEAKPFAGLKNVKWTGGRWAEEIDHGELIRAGYDQTLEVDAHDLRFLFQSTPIGVAWDRYRLGILTSTKVGNTSSKVDG